MNFTKGFNLLKYNSQVLKNLPLENLSFAKAVFLLRGTAAVWADSHPRQVQEASL